MTIFLFILVLIVGWFFIAFLFTVIPPVFWIFLLFMGVIFVFCIYFAAKGNQQHTKQKEQNFFEKNPEHPFLQREWRLKEENRQFMREHGYGKIADWSEKND